jgi:lipopolysaccharide transport system ATP-binding protein
MQPITKNQKIAAGEPRIEYQEQSIAHENEVLVRVNRVSKKFCLDLKKSLWYGVKDVASELLPFGRGAGRRVHGDASQESLEQSEGSPPSASLQLASRVTGLASPPLRAGEFWANKDISFELRRGECIGLIGHNGAGKTTLLKMLNGLIKPDEGTIEMRGRVGALIALGAGFNPILTGRENIYVNGSVLGLTKQEIDEKIEDIIEFSEIGEFIDSPVQSYSSGMTVRLGFAVATAMNPDVLILDEVLAVGDGNFRSKCMKRIGNILTKSAVIFVSHESYHVRRICDKVLWLKKGNPVFFGQTALGMDQYSKEMMENGATVQSCLNLDPCISNFQIEVNYDTKREDGDLECGKIELIMQFDSSEHLKFGMRMGNIMVSGDNAIAQFGLDTALNHIQNGSNKYFFYIPNIRLAKGNYTISLIVYDSTNKRLLINARNFFGFEVSGNLRYGPHYALNALPL